MYYFELADCQWAVLDGDRAVVSTHASQEAAVASARADMEAHARECPLDVKEGLRVQRYVTCGPKGAIDPV